MSMPNHIVPYYADTRTALFHADCLDVLREMPSEYVDSVVTDPPYMLGAASARKSADKAIGWADINNASHWYSAWMGEAWRVMKPTASMWVFANWRLLPVLQCAASRVPGMSIISHVVWDKDWISVGSMRGVREQCELLVLLGKPEFGIPDRSTGNIWRCKWGPNKPTGHPQEKPVELIERMLEASALPENSMVFDGFMGRGSTAVACANKGHRFMGSELEMDHISYARTRLEPPDENGGGEMLFTTRNRLAPSPAAAGEER